MVSITQILAKVFPKLRAIEENPSLIVSRMSTQTSSNPFDTGVNNETYDLQEEVPCIYSEQPEMISGGSNIVTQQQMYFYIQATDLLGVFPTSDGGVLLKDRFIFKDKRYRPIDIQELFGLWKIKVTKE